MPLLKRKPTNRRLGRTSVLDVKLRSDQVRKARVRVAAMTLGVGVGTLLVLLVLWRGGQWTVDKLAFKNPAFAVREVDVQTDGIIRQDQLRRWAGVRPGENLLALDLRRVKRDLELWPIVQSASVDRVLPGTLRIRVTEREPLVRVIAGRAQPDARGSMAIEYHLDPTGQVMLPLERWQTTLPPSESLDPKLPLLVGISPLELRPGRRIESTQVLAALELVNEFGTSPMAGLVDLQQIDVSAPDVIRVLTGQGSEVTFGVRHIALQLRRWRAVHDYGLRYQRALASLDLSVSDNVPARWIEASVVPPATSKPKAPTRSKKKNA
jgi:hypothetical protein